jgi:imidazoleglycerol phosphate synthase glutamine amidotransferase subunit HisH
MTYLGDTFSYTNGTGYLAGAVPKFVCGDDTVPMMGWGEITVVTKFIVMTGQVITREYEFINSSTEPSKEGTYDLIVEYRGEKVLLEDFLTIARE